MNEQQLKAQLEVLHADYARKSLLLIDANKKLDLSYELNKLSKEIIEEQNILIDELKTHIEAISQGIGIIQKTLQEL